MPRKKEYGPPSRRSHRLATLESEPSEASSAVTPSGNTEPETPVVHPTGTEPETPAEDARNPEPREPVAPRDPELEEPVAPRDPELEEPVAPRDPELEEPVAPRDPELEEPVAPRDPELEEPVAPNVDQGPEEPIDSIEADNYESASEHQKPLSPSTEPATPTVDMSEHNNNDQGEPGVSRDELRALMDQVAQLTAQLADSQGTARPANRHPTPSPNESAFGGTSF